MYSMIIFGYITDDLLIFEHSLRLRIFKSLHLLQNDACTRKKWRQYQNEKSVIVKGQMALDR